MKEITGSIPPLTIAQIIREFQQQTSCSNSLKSKSKLKQIPVLFANLGPALFYNHHPFPQTNDLFSMQAYHHHHHQAQQHAYHHHAPAYPSYANGAYTPAYAASQPQPAPSPRSDSPVSAVAAAAVAAAQYSLSMHIRKIECAD